METSFTGYITAHFSFEIMEATKNHCRKAGEKLLNLEIRTVYADDRPELKLAFDILVIAYCERVGERWLKLSCTGDLAQKLNDFCIQKIENYNMPISYAHPLSDTLVPVIRKEQLDGMAHDFIKVYYPKALHDNHRINPIEFAKKIGLHIKMRTLSKDHSIFGEMIFEATQVSVYDRVLDKLVTEEIQGQTILIDPNTYLSRGQAVMHSTLIHECVHWLLHRKAFALEKLFHPSVRLLRTSQVLENSSSVEWMEWQARVLAPRIQMPLVSFKHRTEELQKIYRYLSGSKATSLHEMMFVIDNLADSYTVSKMVAKLRLIDAGFEEARGIYQYVDGRYLKPYVFKRGTLARNQTFTIGLKDAVSQYVENPELRAKLERGAYLYVDGHFCLNYPQYLVKDRFGKLTLTDYARFHMDECCLIFERSMRVKESGREGIDEGLYRDVNSDIHFEAKFSNAENVNEAILIRKRMIELQELILSLPGSFTGTVQRLIKWSEMTLEQVEEKSLISNKTLYLMRTDNNYNPSLEVIIQLCIGLQLPPELSSILLGRSTKQLGDLDLHLFYHFLLNSCYTRSIYECNEMLEAQEFKRLGKES